MSGTYEPLAKVSEARGLDLFIELIDEIEAHNMQTWDQALWIGRHEGLILATMRPDVQEALVPAFDCGTVACLAGHAVFKGGATFNVHMGRRYNARTDLYEDRPRRSYASSESVLSPDGEVRMIEPYAEELLELFPWMALWLFRSDRTWPEVLAFRDAWKDDERNGDGTAARRGVVYRESDDEYA
jgi:hypothetical protein